MATLTCPFPSNINPLSPNGFMFNITKLPQVSFFCQQINLPGILLGSPEFGNPFVTQPIPGESLTYETLDVQFLIDEDMTNYKSIYDWIIALGFPQNYEQYIKFINEDQRGLVAELAKNYSDGVLQILNSNNNPIRTVQFKDMFPVSLNSLVLASTNTDVQYLVGNASFKFGYYDFLS